MDTNAKIRELSNKYGSDRVSKLVSRLVNNNDEYNGVDEKLLSDAEKILERGQDKPNFFGLVGFFVATSFVVGLIGASLDFGAYYFTGIFPFSGTIMAVIVSLIATVYTAKNG